MDTIGFTKELAKRKGISEQTAYRYINTVMDTIRMILADGEEIRIGSFGKFTVVTELNGNKTAVFCAEKSLNKAVMGGD